MGVDRISLKDSAYLEAVALFRERDSLPAHHNGLRRYSLGSTGPDFADPLPLLRFAASMRPVEREPEQVPRESAGARVDSVSSLHREVKRERKHHSPFLVIMNDVPIATLLEIASARPMYLLKWTAACQWP